MERSVDYERIREAMVWMVDSLEDIGLSNPARETSGSGPLAKACSEPRSKQQILLLEAYIKRLHGELMAEAKLHRTLQVINALRIVKQTYGELKESVRDG